jgi:hypothetical protein
MKKLIGAIAFTAFVVILLVNPYLHCRADRYRAYRVMRKGEVIVH